jgi:glycosyltransferase involved in cell wall biosynthesis
VVINPVVYLISGAGFKLYNKVIRRKFMTVKLTAIVLTHNDETIISRCLSSLRFTDEIIVIDDQSNDRTTAIAKKAGVIKIYRHALNGDFAATRNFGLSHATGDWVLFIDSDESVSEALAKEILDAINHPAVNGFYLKRRDYLFGQVLRHGETGNLRLLRLARKGTGLFSRPVHEIWQVSGLTGTLQNSLDHFPHPTLTEFIFEINHYSTLNADYLAKNGVKTNFFQIIGYPLGKFVQNYFWRSGYRDGIPGLLVAVLMSFHSFLTRGKLFLLNRKHG